MTQAQEGLQVLLDMAEDYRKKNNMNSVTISAVGGGTGHAYAFQGADKVTANDWKVAKRNPRSGNSQGIGKIKNNTPLL